MKKIFRWLLSNLLLILIIISVIYSYMFWGNLTGENTPAGKAVAYLSNEFDDVGQFVEGVKNKQARLAGTSSNQQLDIQAVADIDAATSDVDTVNAADIPENELGVEKQAAISGQQLSEDNVQGSASEKASIEKTDDVAQKTQSELKQEKLEQGNSEQANSKLVVAEQTAEELSQAKSKQADESQLGESQQVEQQPVSISYSHNNMHVQQNSDGELDVQPQPLTAQIEDMTTQKTQGIQEGGQLPIPPHKGSLTKNNFVSTFVSTEVAGQLENIDDNGEENGGLEKELSAEKNTEVALESMSIPEVWVIARKSFYQKEYELSEKSYRSVIAGTKDNFDAYGELGNVYFNQGKDTQAAEAYLQAATILLVKGDIQRAQSLLQVLQQLDAAKAKQLQRLIGQPLS